MTSWLRFLPVIICVGACAGRDGAARAPAPARRPPPAIGSSISHTKLCHCRACEPRRCCQGSDEPDPPQCATDDYDFEACGIAIESCTTRCREHPWRVPLAASCEDELPEVCCS